MMLPNYQTRMQWETFLLFWQNISVLFVFICHLLFSSFLGTQWMCIYIKIDCVLQCLALAPAPAWYSLTAAPSQSLWISRASGSPGPAPALTACPRPWAPTSPTSWRASWRTMTKPSGPASKTESRPRSMSTSWYDPWDPFLKCRWWALVITNKSLKKSFQYYSMDCYFRQYWRDQRLSFKGLKNNANNLVINQLREASFKGQMVIGQTESYYLITS